jgi:hypothetical protein
MKGAIMGGEKLKIVGDKPLWDEELRSWLDRYINGHQHHSIEVLTRSDYIGVPRAILEAYLEGSYYLPTGSTEQDTSSRRYDVEGAVRRFRENIEGTVRHNYANRFVETRTWVQVQNACNTAIKRDAIVVVYGTPGMGKTRCLLEYQRRNMVTAPSPSYVRGTLLFCILYRISHASLVSPRLPRLPSSKKMSPKG